MPDASRSVGRSVILLGLLALAGCDGPPPALAPAATLRGHAREVVSLAFSDDGKSLASRSPDAVKVWDVATRSERKSFPSDGSNFSAVAFSPDGRSVAENRAGVGAVAWDLGTGESRTYRHPDAPAEFPGGAVAYGWGLTYMNGGRTLAGAGSHQGADGFVTLWDVGTGEERKSYLAASPVTTVVLGPDGRSLAIGSMSGLVRDFDPNDRRDTVDLPAARPYLAPVAYSPDGRTLAVASDDRRVKLWDLATGREREVLKGHMKAISCVAYHPGGKALASSDSGGVVFLWDLARPRPIAQLEGHKGKVWSVAFSPDGRTLASAGEDRDIRLWDVSDVVPEAGK